MTGIYINRGSICAVPASIKDISDNSSRIPAYLSNLFEKRVHLLIIRIFSHFNDINKKLVMTFKYENDESQDADSLPRSLSLPWVLPKVSSSRF